MGKRGDGGGDGGGGDNVGGEAMVVDIPGRRYVVTLGSRDVVVMVDERGELKLTIPGTITLYPDVEQVGRLIRALQEVRDTKEAGK